jgi:trk system potassium uptake protein TrkA
MSNSLGSNVETLHTIANGRVEAAEFRIKAGAKCVGIPLMNLKLKDNLLIACIIRKGRVIIPGGNDTIEAGDSVIVVSSEIKLYDIDDILL